MADEHYLYRYEVKGIQSFIMATDRLVEMKGGSSLIVELDELFERAREACGLVGDDVEVVAPPAAGGATLRVAGSKLPALERFMAGWPIIVMRHAPGLQVVQAKVPDLGDAREALFMALRGARSRPPAELPEAGPLVLRAPRTGLPAAALGEEPGGESKRELAWDPGAERKRRASEGDDLLGMKLAGSRRWVTNIEEIGHTYVGIFHADGNDLGNHVIEVQRGQGHGGMSLNQFSEKLSRITESAARNAVERVLIPRHGPIPARPIVVGGDDVTFILRADRAFPFAVAYLEEFERLARDEKLDLHASAGIAYVHRSYPFHLGHALAEGLCKFAKGRCRGLLEGEGEFDWTPSSIAFYRLTTSAAEEFEDLRESTLAGSLPRARRAAHGKQRAWLSMCPYTLQPLDGLPTVKALGRLVELIDRERPPGLPSGPLRELITLQQVDGDRAEARWKRFVHVIRQRDEGLWRQCEEALVGLGIDPGDCWTKVVEKKGAGGGEEHASLSSCELATPFLDALTIARARDRE
jgi:hypothetical protein